MLLPLLVVEGDSPDVALISYVNASYLSTFGALERGAPVRDLAKACALHPLVRALSGQDVDAQEVQLSTADGTRRQFLCSATAIRHQGKVSGAVFCVLDQSEQTRSERRLAVQYEVARTVIECEDFLSVAPKILAAVGRHLNWSLGSLWIVEESGQYLTQVAHWQTDAFAGPSPGWSQMGQMRPGEGLPGRVWTNGTPEWVSDLSQSGCCPRSTEARQAGLRAACAFPFSLDGQVVGLFEFFHSEALESDDEMLKTLLVLGTHVGQLLLRRHQEAELRSVHTKIQIAYQREHEIAKRFQNALWPRDAIQLPGYSAAFSYRPMLAEADVGGDFFNLFELDQERMGLVLGDVGGKGLEAAVIAAWFQHALVALAVRQGATPANVLDDAQRLLTGLNFDCIVTVFFAILEKTTGYIRYCSAGQEPALLWRESMGKCERLASGQPALVGLPVDPYIFHETCLSPGDTLFLYTDGLAEAGARQEQLLGEEGVAQLLALYHQQEPDEILRMMCQAATTQSLGQLHDDIAMVAIRRLAAAEAAHPPPVILRRCEHGSCSATGA